MKVGDPIDIKYLVWNNSSNVVEQQWTTGFVEDIGHDKVLVRYVTPSTPPGCYEYRTFSMEMAGSSFICST